LALTAQEIAAARDKLDFVKEKIAGRRKFSSEVREELDALEKGLAERGFDPEFSNYPLARQSSILSATSSQAAASSKFLFSSGVFRALIKFAIFGRYGVVRATLPYRERKGFMALPRYECCAADTTTAEDGRNCQLAMRQFCQR